ncbi:MAG: sugar phosphate permease [Gammaproteobacteria bacterium]|nr:sugar phosphate permease [Gammaproteobacteria bacterium]
MRKPHYAWVVLAITFLVLLISAAIRATPGVLIVPLEQEFGWSRATISFAISINLLLYGLIGPFAAGFVNRYGPRRVMAVSAFLIGLGALATITMKHPWQLIALWGVVVGTGTGIIAIVLGATVVQRWFYLHRGLALGLLTASSATGQLLFLPLLAQVVVSSGWRWAVIIVGLVALIVAPIAFFVMRDRPQDMGLEPLGLPDTETVPAPATGNPFVAAMSALREASHSREFWILAGSFFVCGVSTNGLVGTHLIPACMDHGIPEVQAAGLLAVMGIFDLVGTTGSGWLSDRFDNRLLLLMYYGLRGLALLYLPYGFVSEGHGLSIFAVFYGLDWIATVPPTVALARQAFGAEKAGLVFGWIMAAHQVGAALAASVAGLMRTNEGNYDHAFMIAGVLCVMSAVGVLFAGKRPRGPVLSPQGV